MFNKFVLAFCILALSMFMFPDMASAQLGGEVGFSRSFLRTGGVTTNVGSFSSGLNFEVPMDMVTDGEGNVTQEGTWGFIFVTKFMNDSDLLISTINTNMFSKWKEVMLIAGLQGDFLEPGSASSFEETNCVGVNGAVRFTAQGLPAELGGSYSWSYSGTDDLELSNLHLGLVGSF